MYRHIEISKLQILTQILAQIKEHPGLAMAIQRLGFDDFCDPSGLPTETGNPLLEVLDRTPLIREFRINKHMERYLSYETLQKIFCGLPYLETLDLSACDSLAFVEGCLKAICGDGRVMNSIRSVSLAGCSTLPPEFFGSLLRQLPSLQHLDISNSQITASALSHIPATARLIRLDISHCDSLAGAEVVDFLSQHPSVKSVEYLNIETTSGGEDSILTEEDISKLLSHVSPSLKILNLKNSAMASAHVPLLQTLSLQLDELCIGSHLQFKDIEQLFFDFQIMDSEENDSDDAERDGTDEIESKYQAVLNPMEEAMAVCKLRQRINSFPESSKQVTLRYLDISSLPVGEQCKIRMSVLLGPQSRPLEVIEISEEALRKVGVLEKLCAAVGWEVKSVGRRYWLRRKVVG